MTYTISVLLGEARKLLFLPPNTKLNGKRTVIEKFSCFMKLLSDCHQTPLPLPGASMLP